jgi:glutamine cyclotransferase
MKLYKLLSLSLLTLICVSCGGKNNHITPFTLKLSGVKNGVKNGTPIAYVLQNKTQQPISKAVFSVDGKILKSSNDSLYLDLHSLGNKTLEVAITYGENSYKISEKIRVFAKEAPSLYTYKIINTFPHDEKAYTQGLEFYKDTLYESTGLRGYSSLRKVNYKTGEVLKKIDLPAAVFGEGISILNNQIYLLSWQSGKGYIYDLESFEEKGQFSYGQSKEGWGLCNDGLSLFKSDGSQKIWRLDPENLKEIDHIELATHKGFFKNTNELEYVNGKIYANVYLKESVMIVNATSGAIEGVVNFSGLKELVNPHPDLDVLNGIAYHPGRKTFFVTGKKWNKMFEVQLEKK